MKFYDYRLWLVVDGYAGTNICELQARVPSANVIYSMLLEYHQERQLLQWCSVPTFKPLAIATAPFFLM